MSTKSVAFISVALMPLVFPPPDATPGLTIRAISQRDRRKWLAVETSTISLTLLKRLLFGSLRRSPTRLYVTDVCRLYIGCTDALGAPTASRYPRSLWDLAFPRASVQLMYRLRGSVTPKSVRDLRTDSELSLSVSVTHGSSVPIASGHGRSHWNLALPADRP